MTADQRQTLKDLRATRWHPDEIAALDAALAVPPSRTCGTCRHGQEYRGYVICMNTKSMGFDATRNIAIDDGCLKGWEAREKP